MRLPFRTFGALAGLMVEVATCDHTVDGTILVLGRTTADAEIAAAGLKGYGIAYEAVAVPQTGIELPSLNSSSDHGNYGGIVLLSEVSYEFEDGWRSAITEEQFDALFKYQVDFGVRMVRLDAFPSSEFGKSVLYAVLGQLVVLFIYLASADSLTRSRFTASCWE